MSIPLHLSQEVIQSIQTQEWFVQEIDQRKVENKTVYEFQFDPTYNRDGDKTVHEQLIELLESLQLSLLSEED